MRTLVFLEKLWHWFQGIVARLQRNGYGTSRVQEHPSQAIGVEASGVPPTGPHTLEIDALSIDLVKRGAGEGTRNYIRIANNAGAQFEVRLSGDYRSRLENVLKSIRVTDMSILPRIVALAPPKTTEKGRRKKRRRNSMKRLPPRKRKKADSKPTPSAGRSYVHAIACRTLNELEIIRKEFGRGAVEYAIEFPIVERKSFEEELRRIEKDLALKRVEELDSVITRRVRHVTMKEWFLSIDSARVRSGVSSGVQQPTHSPRA